MAYVIFFLDALWATEHADQQVHGSVQVKITFKILDLLTTRDFLDIYIYISEEKG